MNSWSARTSKENSLRTKTKSFKDNFKLSEDRIRSTSSLHNLAGKIYSQSENKKFTPVKSKKAEGLSIISQKSQVEEKGANPESGKQSTRKLRSSGSLSGLSMRTSNISNFSQMNTSLLIEKKNLEQRIAHLKESIVIQKHKLDKADKNCKKNANGVQKYKDLYNDANTKSNKLQEQIDLTNKDCNRLKRQNHNLNERIQEKRRNIDNQRKWCEQLDQETKDLKVKSLVEDKMRTQAKSDLSNSQRVMKSACTYCKQLEDERAFLLLQINQSVAANKI